MLKTNRKQVIALLLLVATLLLLTSCNSKESVDNSTTPSPETTVEIVTENISDEPLTSPSADPTGTVEHTPTVGPTAEVTNTPAPSPTVSATEEVSVEAMADHTADLPTDASTAVAPKEPSHGIFDPWYSVQTSISYSSGTDSDWSYGNQRKEFPVTKPCYVRIGSSISADWHWGWNYGEGKAITITYRFTGAAICDIEVSDGFVTRQESDDPNVVIFTRTLVAKTSHEEDIVIFRYNPSQVGSISLEVIYDDQVKSQYDERNTVYFIEEEY